MDKLTLQFKPYADADVVNIINKKIKAIAADLERDSAFDNETDRRLSGSGKKGRNAATVRGEYPVGDDQMFQYMEVLRDILPRLRMTTGHLDEMLNVALMVWRLSGKDLSENNQETGVHMASSSHSRIAQHVLKLPFLRYDGADGRENSSFDSDPDQVIDPESCKYCIVPLKSRFMYSPF